jgi:aspartate aminotransferase
MIALSPTARLRQRAAALRGSGSNVYDLSAGELDLATPAHIVAAAVDAVARPENHHYGPAAGDERLRHAVAARLALHAPGAVGAASVLITHGAKQALFNALMALLHSGDEVLIPAPYWVTFPSAVRLAQGVPVIAQPPAGSLKITPESLDAGWTPATRALILCSPNNPTGLVYSGSELADILGWAVERNLWVLADETYVDLGFRPVPAPAVIEPRIIERLITIGGVSKSFAMTGWRVGWIAGPQKLVEAATAVQSHTTSNVSGVAQSAALAALTGPDVTAGFRSLLRGRLALCTALLNPLGVLDVPPDGAFYLFPDISRFDPDDVRLADRLLDSGVITAPGTAFGCPGRIRLSFAIDENQLRTGLQTMAEILERAA